MKIKDGGTFGDILRKVRLEKGWSQRELAHQAGLDASYVNRLESGDRQPGRDAALVLAGALSVDEANLDHWLTAAGHAPMPLLTQVRGAVRTRGAQTRPLSESANLPRTLSREVQDLEKMGLGEAGIRRLLQAMEGAGSIDRRLVAQAVSGTLTRLADALESPVRSAVIPAAGRQHRLVAEHVIQRLLLRVIAEAVDEGIHNIILVLAPGSEDSLYAPLKEAADMMVIPYVRLAVAIQDKPEGLGDAILRAEKLVGNAPFAVLLPDDFVRESRARDKYPQALHAMLSALRQSPGISLLAVTPVPKTRVSSYGIARLDPGQAGAGLRQVEKLVEKPDVKNPVCRGERILRVAGRYLLQPGIFQAIREVRQRRPPSVELTDAIDLMRSKEGSVYALEVRQSGEDIGRLFERTRDIILSID